MPKDGPFLTLFRSFLGTGFDGNAQLVELVAVDFAGGFGHEVDGGGGFGEGHDFADGFFAGEEHDDAVHAESNTAVGRGAVGEGVEEEAEAAAEKFFREAQGFEEALLNVLAVDSNAAGAEFDAVEDEVVTLGADFPGPTAAAARARTRTRPTR